MVAYWKKRADELARLANIRPAEVDDSPSTHGVLTSDEITRLATQHNLIDPFNPDHLKPAAYHLTIGQDYFLNGEFVTLDGEKDTIALAPFEVVVLQTAETVCMPRFLIGRWNLLVRQVYRGLLWVGAPQVDPGYVGHLFCPIYNLSDTTVYLKKGDQLAIIDFVKTTPVTDKTLRYPGNTRSILEDFGIDHLKSALFTKAGVKIIEVEQSLKSIETRFAAFTTITFATLALVVASIAALVKVDADLRVAASIWGSLTLALSLGAFLLALFWSLFHRYTKFVEQRIAEFSSQGTRAAYRFARRHWWIGFSISVGASVAMATFIYVWSTPFFDDIRRQRVLVKSDITSIEKTLSDTAASIAVIDDRTRKDEDTHRQQIDSLARQLDDFRRQLDAIRNSSKP